MGKLACAAFGAVVLAVASAGRAQEEPAPAAAAPVEFALDDGGFEIHASPDGKWVGCRTSKGVLLYPTAGGSPVRLDCGKDEYLGSNFAFSPDSKYVCIAGRASPAVVKGLPEDKTQSVFMFTLATPTKRRKVELVLKAEGVSSDVKKHLDPRLRSMKMLSGEVREFIPFAGSRVLFDRGELGLTIWDLGTEAKFAAPPALDSTLFCGISADGARCVRIGPKGIEVRDVKTNRVLQTVPTPDYEKKGTSALYPTFTRDGASVVVMRRIEGPKEENGPGSIDTFEFDCWSLADGKRVWQSTAGSGKYCRAPLVAASHLVVHVDERVSVKGLADGVNVSHDLDDKNVTEVCVAASGDALWAVIRLSTLMRIALPPPAAK